MRDDTFLPITQARKDIAAYTYSYHMPGGSNEETDPFWKNSKIRQLLLTESFDHHEWCHRCSCFKKGCECRFCFPFPLSLETFIHEDFGNDNENVTSWPHIDEAHSAMDDCIRKKAPVPLCQCSQCHSLRGLELQQQCSGWGSLSHVLHHVV